tara:strand:- start:541 stop:2028 length:1488 start_codon:yes stop_codon:yes gene_type:complete
MTETSASDEQSAPRPHPERATVVGLDFGSTTSSMMVVEVGVSRHSVTGRMSFSSPTVLLRSDPVLTPFEGDGLNAQALSKQLDSWLEQLPDANIDMFAGASLITGLAARSDNATLISEQVLQRLGGSLIATADDPKLESWLAFMGSCGLLSRARPHSQVINLDIGGGTTNPALGLNGQVSHCGCHFIGARHVQFEPGSYRLHSLSPFATRLLPLLDIPLETTELSQAQVSMITQWMVRGLEALVTPNDDWFEKPEHRIFEQVSFAPELSASNDTSDNQPDTQEASLITFSGGVGELIYAHQQSGLWPSTTHFGDLGIDLAQAIVASPVLSRNLDVSPATAGRATVMGLTLHSCDISGSSLYVPMPDVLPLQNVPVVARIPVQQPGDVRPLLDLAKGCSGGACLQLLGKLNQLDDIRHLADSIKTALVELEFPTTVPLVFLAENNIGKTLGSYLTNWGSLPYQILVIDEIPDRNARFIHVGKPFQSIVPVSFFGMG